MHLQFRVSVIASPENVPEDKHELPSNQTQAPSGMVVLSEIVKITKVTCETEVINKVSNIDDCSGDPSEAGTKMVEEEKQDSDCNQVGFFQHTQTLSKAKCYSLLVVTNEYLFSLAVDRDKGEGF